MFFLKELPSQAMVESYLDSIFVNESNASLVLNRLRYLREASLLIRRLDKFFSEQNLSQLRFLIMIVIDREAEQVSLSHKEISTRIDVSKPVMTRTLKGMIEDGYLDFEQGTSDGRTKHYSLSVSGQRKLHSILPAYFKLLESQDLNF